MSSSSVVSLSEATGLPVSGSRTSPDGFPPSSRASVHPDLFLSLLIKNAHGQVRSVAGHACNEYPRVSQRDIFRFLFRQVLHRFRRSERPEENRLGVVAKRIRWRRPSLRAEERFRFGQPARGSGEFECFFVEQKDSTAFIENEQIWTCITGRSRLYNRFVFPSMSDSIVCRDLNRRR